MRRIIMLLAVALSFCMMWVGGSLVRLAPAMQNMGSTGPIPPPYGSFGHSKSLFCKVHAVLANRLNMSRIVATSMNVSLVCTFRS